MCASWCIEEALSWADVLENDLVNVKGWRSPVAYIGLALPAKAMLKIALVLYRLAERCVRT